MKIVHTLYVSPFSINLLSKVLYSYRKNSFKIAVYIIANKKIPEFFFSIFDLFAEEKGMTFSDKMAKIEPNTYRPLEDG